MFSTDWTNKWFKSFTDNYKTEGILHAMLDLKFKHSKRVSLICSEIADSMGWDEYGDSWLAHTAGLLHDVGRFPQYSKYGTFFDSVSVDHGDLGAEIISREFDWEGIPENFRENVISAVKFHNKKLVPTDIKLGAYKWSCLVRDADKIDIFRMVEERIDKGTIFEMLPRHQPAEGLSSDLVEEIRKTGSGSYSNASSLQDYRLIQLTWGCDLNFPVSVATIKEEKIIERIREDLLPFGITDLVDDLISRIYSMA
ncbi:MAG: HD domain-containing protein [Synergistaceae bacterium]|nr:HD domain-containing protein [Synergistaceae bacterium]